MHPLIASVATSLLVLAGAPAFGATCPEEPSDMPVAALIQNAPLGKQVVVAGCYAGTRHGLSLHECKAGFGSGIWMDFTEGLQKDPAVEAFLTAAFGMQAYRDRPRLRVRVSGRLVKTDAYVPGGTAFLASALHCFEAPPVIPLKSPPKR